MELGAGLAFLLEVCFLFVKSSGFTGVAPVPGTGVMVTFPLTFLINTWGPDLRLLLEAAEGGIDGAIVGGGGGPAAAGLLPGIK